MKFAIKIEPHHFGSLDFCSVIYGNETGLLKIDDIPVDFRYAISFSGPEFVLFPEPSFTLAASVYHQLAECTIEIAGSASVHNLEVHSSNDAYLITFERDDVNE